MLPHYVVDSIESFSICVSSQNNDSGDFFHTFSIKICINNDATVRGNLADYVQISAQLYQMVIINITDDALICSKWRIFATERYEYIHE